MRVFVAIVLGFLAACVAQLIGSMILASFAAHLSGNVGVVLVLSIEVSAGLTGILSVVWMLRGADSALRVFKKGCLFGAGEWLLMIVVGVAYSASFSSDLARRVTHDGRSDVAGAALAGGGIFAVLTGAVSVAMIGLCLLAYFIAHLAGKETHVATPNA